MKKITCILLLASSLLGVNFYDFSEAKKLLLKRVYFDNPQTIYCGVDYEMRRVKGAERAMLIQNSSRYTPRKAYTKSGDLNPRTQRVEWEHIMPAHTFGGWLRCWKQGGRKNCGNDRLFNAMEGDMYNLAPSVGEVNDDRSNFRFGADLPRAYQYGKCPFEVDFKGRRAYPRAEIRGWIARAYLYMAERYNVRLSSQEMQMFRAWNRMYAPTKREIQNARRIQTLQGNENKFITRWNEFK